VTTVDDVLADLTLTEAERANIRLVLHFRTVPFAERSKYTVDGFRPDRFGMANLAELKDPDAPGYDGGSVPDRTDEMLDIIAHGDWVWAVWKIHGTHLGPMYGLPPSGRTLEILEIGRWRIQNGLIAQAWFLVDELAVVRQTGTWAQMKEATR
jgi:hypothetical protein